MLTVGSARSHRDYSDVGTRLYMAPEMSIQSSDYGGHYKKEGKKNKVVAPRTTSKADMYSLGVGFFLNPLALRGVLRRISSDSVLRDELLLQDGLRTQQGHP